MAHFYTADPHYGHTNILKLCNRPFADVDEMNRVMLERTLARVGPDDDLWVIGDFSFKSSGAAITAIFDKIPGRKHLVEGNHDGRRVTSLNWHSIRDIAEVEDGDQPFVLCHYPMITWNRSRYGVLQLFGHVHGNWAGSSNSINMGVDLWDFAPATKEEILARALTLPENPIWSLCEPGAASGPRKAV